VSRAAEDHERLEWISGSPARRAMACARLARIRALSLRTILLLSLMMAFIPTARADTFATAARAYARQNYVLAAGIFLPLAEQGDPRAQTYLGIMYLRGEGAPQDFKVAAYWLHIASEAGVSTAQYFFGLMYDKGQGVPQDFVVAHAWLNLAVAHAEPRLRRRWVLIRDAVASKMTEAQLADARRLAYEWRPEPAWVASDWHPYMLR
jgi:uncharacterized protein